MSEGKHLRYNSSLCHSAPNPSDPTMVGTRVICMKKLTRYTTLMSERLSVFSNIANEVPIFMVNNYGKDEILKHQRGLVPVCCVQRVFRLNSVQCC